VSAIGLVNDELRIGIQQTADYFYDSIRSLSLVGFRRSGRRLSSIGDSSIG